MLRFLFWPVGRLSRRAYWAGFLAPVLLATAAAMTIDYYVFGVGAPKLPFGLLRSLDLTLRANQILREGVVTPIFLTACLWPGLAVSMKRYRDVNSFGFWILIPPLLNAIVFFTGNFRGDILMLLRNFEFDGWASLSVIAMPIILPVIALAMGVSQAFECALAPGSKLPNRFGPSPLERGGGG